MTQRELWEMIGAGGGGGGGRWKQHYEHIIFLSTGICQGFFCTESIIRKKNGQVLNKPQMRLLLKKILEVTFCKSRQISVAVYFIISVNFFFHFYLGMVMYVNEFETRENEN